MFEYWGYWKNIELRVKITFLIILMIIFGFLLKLSYNLYFNPLYILEKYYSSMREARMKYDVYNRSYEENHFYYYQPEEKLKEYLNEMIEERKKYVLNPEKAEKLMKKYYDDLEEEDILLEMLLFTLNKDNDLYTKLHRNIKSTKYGYTVYLINPMIVGYTLNSKNEVIEKLIYKDKIEKIKYPENSEITFYIVRTWKGLKIDWIKSVYLFK